MNTSEDEALMPIHSSAPERRRPISSVVASAVALGILTIAVAFGLIACKPQGTKSLSDIRAAYNEGDFERAERELRSVIDDEPENLEARRLLGLTLAAQGDNAGALDQYQKVIADDLVDHETRYRAALLETLSGDTESAIRMLEAAAEIQPESTYLDALARGYMEVGRYQEAADTWLLAIESPNVTPDMQVAFLRMGAGAFTEANDEKSAREAIVRAIEISPDDKSLRQALKDLDD